MVLTSAARTALEEAGPIWEQLGNQAMLAENRANRSVERLHAGDLKACLAFSQESNELSKHIKNDWGQVNSRVFVSLAYWARGEIDTALEVLKATIPIARRVGHPGETLNLVQLSWIYESLGAEGPAFQAAREATEVSGDFPPSYVYALNMLARLYLHAGDLAKTGEFFQQAAETGHTRTILAINLLIDLVDSEYQLARGETERAAGMLEELLKLISESGARFFLPEVLSFKAGLLDRGDRVQEAYETLQTALRVAEEIGLRMEAWRIHARLSALARRLENIPAAEGHHSLALQTLEQISEQISDPDLVKSFKSLATPLINITS